MSRLLIYLITLLSFLPNRMLYSQLTLAFSACEHVLENNVPYAKPFFPSNLNFIDYSSVDIEAAKLLSAYLKIPAHLPHDSSAALHLSSVAERLGLYVSYFYAPDGTLNFSASVFPLSDKKPNILFLNHTDVVVAGDTANWVHPPYEGVIDKGFVWGRGAYDNKGSAIIQLLALSRIANQAREESWSVNFTALSLAGEESFHPYGAEYLTDYHLDELNVLAVIGEGPAGLKGKVGNQEDHKIFAISVSHKRALWLKLILEYESSGHGSVPPINYPNKDMVKSISKLLDQKQPIILNNFNTTMLQELGDLEGGFKGFFIKNIHLFKPFASRFIRREPMYNAFFSNTISLTSLSNSSITPNSIPNRIEAILDCRLLPGYDTDKFIKDIEKTLADDKIKVSILRETPDAPPSFPDHPVYKYLEKSIQNIYDEAIVIPVMLQSTTDSNYFRAKNIPVFSTVPILMTTDLLKRVHSNNERVPIISLGKATDIWVDFMKNFNKYCHSKSKVLKDNLDDVNAK